MRLSCLFSKPVFKTFFLSLNHQINFVKDQQDDITAKLSAEYLALEEEIISLGLEASFSLLVLRVHIAFCFRKKPISILYYSFHLSLRSACFSVSQMQISKHFIIYSISQNWSYCPPQTYLTSASDNLVSIENIPEEVLDSDCPYPELKDSLIQAFRSLSERYQSRLQSLQDQLQRTDRYSRLTN